jgi:hypothetical protein
MLGQFAFDEELVAHPIDGCAAIEDQSGFEGLVVKEEGSWLGFRRMATNPQAEWIK